MTRPRGGFSDLEVVPTAALAEVLGRWIDEWRAERPPYNAEGGAIGADNFYSSFQWLVDNAGVAERVVYRILHHETKTTTLYVADKLLSAIGRIDYLANGTVPIVPNPNLSNESWQAAMRARGCDVDD